MLKVRIYSAIVMILVALLALFGLSPLPFTLGLSGIIALAMWEWAQFVEIKRPISRVIVALVTFSLLIFPIIANTDHIQAARFLTDETTPLLFVGGIWWVIAAALVVTYPKSATLWQKSTSAKFIFGFFTLIPFMIATLALRFYHYNFNPYQGTFLLLYVFLLVWGADSGAYFAGRAFGKHKLAPQVSPGKSWEGAISGVFTSALIAVIFLFALSNEVLAREVNPLAFITLSVMTAIISVFGDLTESMFKRQAGIKDSSHLIPGHGGILDRLDSLTAAVPIFAIGFFFLL